MIGAGEPADSGITDNTIGGLPQGAGIVIGCLIAAVILSVLALAPVQAGDSTVATSEYQSVDVATPLAAEIQPTASFQAASASDHLTEISGQVQFLHEDGHLQPARQVTVRILEDGILDSEITTTTTDDNGEYSAFVDVAEHTDGWWSSDDLDLKVQVVAENPAADVVSPENHLNFDGNGGTYATHETTTVTTATSQRTVDVTIEDERDRRAFQIAEASLEAYEFTEETAGWTRDQLKTQYPAHFGYNMYVAPLDLVRITDSGWHVKDRTVHHEYGHAVMGALFDYSGWVIPGIDTWLVNDQGNWFPCHRLYSETDEHYAWYEGFAEFFEAAVVDDPEVRGDLVNEKYYKMDVSDDECHDGSDDSEYNGDVVEGAIASILWALYNDTGQSFDEMDEPIVEIFGTVAGATSPLSEYPERNVAQTMTIHDFWDQFVNEDNHDAVRKIFFNYGIQKPDRFEPNDSMDEAALIDVDDTIEAQLNFDDIDYFEFQPESSGNVTVELQRQLGDGLFELIVYDADGDIYAKSLDDPAPDRDLFFPVAAGEQYFIEVSNPDATNTAGAYELTVESSSTPLSGIEFVEVDFDLDYDVEFLMNATQGDIDTDGNEIDGSDDGEGDEQSSEEPEEDSNSIWDSLGESTDDDDNETSSIWDFWFTDDEN